MGFVSSSKLQKDMILKSPVFLPSGRKILNKGVTLTDKHVEMLKVWGVAYADIVGTDEEEIIKDEVHLQRVFDESDRLVSAYFPSNMDGMEILYALCRDRCARYMTLGQEEYIQEILNPQLPDSLPSKYDLPRDKPSFEAIVGSDIPLSSLPDIYLKIQEVVNSPVSSATSIARVVSKDPNLSLRILRLVNSAFYAFPSPIKSISRAIAIIGMRELSSLALAVSTMRVFEHIPSKYVDMKSFWKHSISCGVIARILAYHCKNRKEELFFTAGVLHDVGRALLFCQEPEWMAHALEVSRFFKLPLVEVERRLLGFDHAQVTMRLLEKWNIPEPIKSLAAFHHEPYKSDNPQEVSLIWLADLMANAMKIGSSGTHFISPMRRSFWELAGIEEEELQSIFVQSERQIREILHIFLIL